MKINLALFLAFLTSGWNAAIESPKKVETKSLYSYFDQKKGELVLKGNAEIHRDGISLYANEIFFHESKKEAFATGLVRLEMDQITLNSGQIRVYLKGNKTFSALQENEAVVIAQKHPRLIEKDKNTGLINEITAVEIKFYKGDEKIEAFENVKLVQGGAKDEKPTVITGNYLEYNHLQGKALIKNNVKIVSPGMGGQGDRLIYYRKDEKFYLIGNALIFEMNEQNQKINEVKSEKILHLIREKRTIQMGDVEGVIRVSP